jgi:hypothetical protein
MSDQPEFEGNGAAEDPEMSDAFRAGMRQAGYHVLRAGYELLAGVSAFLEAVGGGGQEDGSEGPVTERIEVE